jgi:hypothetical protein
VGENKEFSKHSCEDAKFDLSCFFIKLNGVRTACTSHILESWNFIVHSERFFCS